MIYCILQYAIIERWNVHFVNVHLPKSVQNVLIINY